LQVKASPRQLVQETLSQKHLEEKKKTLDDTTEHKTKYNDKWQIEKNSRIICIEAWLMSLPYVEDYVKIGKKQSLLEMEDFTNDQEIHVQPCG
jgi:hypothetical protein